MKVDVTQNLPIKMWIGEIELGALKQAHNLANLPYAFHHIAIMPDAHLGYGMPIGGVMATKNVVVPNAVGVDIGCGMYAMKTSLRTLPRETLKRILGLIRERIPVGFNKHHRGHTILMPDFGNNCLPIVDREYRNACKSMGTLGGGNHFIEFQLDDEGFMWVMIHSGSRNLGKQVADHYNKIAKKLNEKWRTGIQSSFDLAFLPMDTSEGRSYIHEMEYCVDFALANRRAMMMQVSEAMKEVISDENMGMFTLYAPINIAHNYARMEHHFGKNVMVHRKGATSARLGEYGVIPGSQGTCSYIVEGRGNPDSFQSCSHGAGRNMGRKQACKTLSLKEQQDIMDGQGILHGLHSEKDLDEAAGAYKNIEVVMEHQQDLVDIQTRLHPIAVVKG